MMLRGRMVSDISRCFSKLVGIAAVGRFLVRAGDVLQQRFGTLRFGIQGTELTPSP